jgi:uncharacterized repeat protein (TIGR02543 family)
MDAGDYYISIRLYKGDELHGTVSDIVHVRKDLLSEKEYTLGWDDLNLQYVINYKFDVKGGAFKEDEGKTFDYYLPTEGFTLPEAGKLFREGYAFEGWYEELNFTTKVARIEPGTTGDKDFYPNWTVIPVENITLNSATLTLQTDTTSTLTATVSPDNAYKDITWESSDPNVAGVTLTDGNVLTVTVTGKAAGTATITAASSSTGKEASCTVTVTIPTIPVTGVNLNVTTLTLQTGTISTLTATVSPDNASNKGVTWKSSDSSVAKVSSTGTVTGVAKGTANITVTTNDGSKWKRCAVTVTDGWDGTSRVVIVPYSGDPTFLSSDKGVSWARPSTGSLESGHSWQGVTYGNGVFVTVGDKGAVAYSNDGGQTWTTTTVPNSTNNTRWWDVAYGVVNGTGVFVTVDFGPDGKTSTHKAAYSTDGGKNWIPTYLPIFSLWRTVAYGNGVFVAGGENNNIAWSDDGGKNWHEAPPPAISSPTPIKWQSVAYGNGVFVAVSLNGKAVYSADGQNWTESTLPNGNYWWEVAFGDGVFVTVCAYTRLAAWSTDGITWTEATLPETTQEGVAPVEGVDSGGVAGRGSWYQVIAAEGHVFLAFDINDHLVAVSVDKGKTWTKRGNISSGSLYGNNMAYGRK